VSSLDMSNVLLIKASRTLYKAVFGVKH